MVLSLIPFIYSDFYLTYCRCSDPLFETQTYYIVEIVINMKCNEIQLFAASFNCTALTILCNTFNACLAYSLCLLLQIKRVNAETYKKTFEEIVRNIDKMENECIPSVTLSKREVSFP